jgi:hypothetical protein
VREEREPCRKEHGPAAIPSRMQPVARGTVMVLHYDY